MAILTSKERSRLRSTEFAVPSTRSYPISDEAHARNALSRVAQFGSNHEQAQVRAVVHRKFPDVGKKQKSIGHRIVELGRHY